MRTIHATATSLAALALASAGAGAIGAEAAQAYTINGDGTYTITMTELQAAFGGAVNPAEVTFTVEGGNTVYLVPCQKTVHGNGKTIKHDFRRQSVTTWSVAATPVSTNGAVSSFTLALTKTGVGMYKVVCPPAFTLKPGATPSPIGTTDVEVIASYRGVAAELMPTAS